MPDPILPQSAHASPSHGPSSAGTWLVKLPAPVRVDRLADLNADLALEAGSSRGRRIMVAVTRFVLTFCVGGAATLAWQPYGDAARERIANATPQFNWLAPQVVPALAASPLPDVQQRVATPADLDAVREHVDRIASSQEQVTRAVAQLTASQERLAQELTKIREVEQYLLYKASYKGADAPPPQRPVHGPAHKITRHASSPVR